MISVETALGRIFDLLQPLDAQEVALADAAGRVLASPLSAARDQPPFAASAMDGYALNSTEAETGAMFKVIGASAAGHRFSGSVGPGQTVRIFTGAPVPDGADRVVIQEDVTRNGDTITLDPELGTGLNIRPAGDDFRAGFQIAAPCLLSPAMLALIAAMNVARVRVCRRPVVAIIATGDELVMPGETPGPDQIIASNNFGLQAMVEAAGAEARMLPIARDRETSLKTVLGLAAGADLIVTIGGASVGDHDIVGKVAQDIGLERAFYKVAMRPGKPLMAGRIGPSVMIGLPGNPVSSMVCGHVFVLPALRAMLGLGAAPAPRMRARLTAPVAANGPRQHYMRARVTGDGLAPLPRQDSALLSVLAEANALLVRSPGDAARDAGATVEYLPI